MTSCNLKLTFWSKCCDKVSLQELKYDKNPVSIDQTTSGGTFFKVGDTSARQKDYRKFLRFELATVTSQALKYDVITYTSYEGLTYTIFDKFTPLWKRIDEPPEIQIGCYRGDPGH